MKTASHLTGPAATARLNNGVEIPRLGLGVFRTEDGHAVRNAVAWALDAGYRHIDTARIYGNESGVGEALAEAKVPREEIFVTTKVWNDDLRRHRTREAVEESLSRLGLDYVDLLLIHWPVAEAFVDAWKAMEDLYGEGKA
ncbi:MAG: aldo/keto reductase, partial [Anaerolineae bacterium]